LHSYCIVRHMLTKWTDHPPGIADEASTVVGIKRMRHREVCVLRVVPCMFTYRCVSIIFSWMSFMYRYLICSSSGHVGQPECAALQYRLPQSCMSDCGHPNREATSRLGYSRRRLV